MDKKLKHHLVGHTGHALSIRQPHLENILSGKKKFEYRSRPIHVRGRVWLYSPRLCDEGGEGMPTRLILGSVELAGSEPVEGRYRVALRNPLRLDVPLLPSGQPQPGLWKPTQVEPLTDEEARPLLDGPDESPRLVTAYSWGYWGWGTQIEHFLEAAEAHEAAAGYGPPAFADVRLQRTGRAPAFRGNTLENVVGKDRYRWFPGLGNSHIADHSSGIKIANPSEANALLDYIKEQATKNRRVLFYCACEHIEVDGHANCHRRKVADLLLDAAKKGKTGLEVVEWPGHPPVKVEISLEEIPKTIGANLRIGDEFPPEGIATLPMGSEVELYDGEDLVAVFGTGPAKFKSGGWQLPVLLAPDSYDDEGMQAFRQELETYPAYFGCLARKV
jgi:hypothetical protein